MYWMAGIGASVVLGWLEWRRRYNPLWRFRPSPRIARWPYGDPTKALPGENLGSISPSPPPIEDYHD